MMECFTCIDLLLDIAGVTLLWFFGLPNIVSINKTNELPLKETIKILEERGELAKNSRNIDFAVN